MLRTAPPLTRESTSAGISDLEQLVDLYEKQLAEQDRYTDDERAAIGRTLHALYRKRLQEVRRLRELHNAAVSGNSGKDNPEQGVQKEVQEQRKKTDEELSKLEKRLEALADRIQGLAPGLGRPGFERPPEGPTVFTPLGHSDEKPADDGDDKEHRPVGGAIVPGEVFGGEPFSFTVSTPNVVSGEVEESVD